MRVNLSFAIRQTLSYASFFKFNLRPQEVHHWLITPKPVSFSSLRPLLPPPLSPSDEKKRLRLTRLAQKKIASAQSFVSLLSRLPTIKFIAVTGSLAIHNTKAGDDIDLMLVTAPHTLWLTRLLVTALSTFFGRRRYPSSIFPPAQNTSNTFCLNLWLEEPALSVPLSKRNLYTAHEALQILPLYDASGYYRHFLAQNSWAADYLANAYSALTRPSKSDQTAFIHPRRFSLTFLFFPINYLAFLIQYLYMQSKITEETITLHSAYFHPRSLHPKIQKHLAS